MPKIISEIEAVNRCQKYKIQLIGPYKNTQIKTKFKCYCGNIFIARPYSIFTGNTKSCGCYHKIITQKLFSKDLTKHQLNRLFVIKLIPQTSGRKKYLCECSCGKIVVVQANNLTSGNTKSCGCLNDELMCGESHPRYNHNLTDEDRANKRITIEHKKWKIFIFEKDNYTCQICHKRGGELNAHHLDGYHWCVERRFDVSNGVCLCDRCHHSFHNQFGWQNNTSQQFSEFSKNTLNTLDKPSEFSILL